MKSISTIPVEDGVALEALRVPTEMHLGWSAAMIVRSC